MRVIDNSLTAADAGKANLYKLEGRISPLHALFFAFQHVVSMFVGNVAPIAIVTAVAKHNGAPMDIADIAGLIQATMIVAGLATLIQVFPVWRVGARLPIVMGTSFTFLGGCLLYAAQDYSILIGAILVCGMIEGCLGLLAPWWRKIFPPITSACVIITLGISLANTGIYQFAGAEAADAGNWPHLLVGFLTISACIFAQVRLGGIWKQLNILFGLAIGYIIASILTLSGWASLIDFATLRHNIVSQGLIAFPKLCPYEPTFHGPAILVFTILCLTTAAVTIGSTDAICHVCLKRSATDKEVAGSVSCEGFANSLLSVLFGCLPVTTYTQNVGILTMTKIINLGVVAMGAGILILAGLIPPIGAAFASFPNCVFGGCLVLIFGSIITSGISMLVKAGITTRNLLIASIALSVGLGAAHTPLLFSHCSQLTKELFAANPVVLVFFISFTLSHSLPKALDATPPNTPPENK